MASQRTSLSVPATQNTAPVIKFQCLFTHDVRRKAKRWQDGFLRFHTFNKRVMVYETSGNLVGDLHWRDRDMLQDGDEFELDKGVLIQAGERLESTVTDLSGLLEKRKASPRKPSPNRTYQSSIIAERHNEFRAPYPSSSGKLKSLNEVLGIKRDLLATKTVSSPYEERQKMNQRIHTSGRDDRPTKRRKAVPEGGEGKLQQLPSTSLPTSSHPSPPSPPSPPLRRSPVLEQRSSTTVRQVSVEKISTKIPREASNFSTRAASGVKDLCRKTSNKYQSGFSSASKVTFRPASTVEAEPSPCKGRNKKSSGTTASNQTSLTTIFGNSPTTTLEIAPRKPRNKLTMLESIPAQIKLKERRKLAERAALADEDFRKRSELESSSSALTPKDTNIRPYQSTAQFLKNEDDADDDSNAPHVSKPKITSLLDFFGPSIASTSQSNISCDVGSGAGTKPDDSAHRRVPVEIRRCPSTTDAIDPDQITPTLAQEEETVQTITSESGSLVITSERNAPPEKSALDLSALQSSRPASKKRIIQTTLFPGQICLPPVDEPEEQVEQGPWTTEALDLFDWWPPGRLKPGPVSVA